MCTFVPSFTSHMNNYVPRIRLREGKQELFDAIRKKFVALTPEELVRQQLIEYLLRVKKFPQSLMRVEVALTCNNCACRADIIAYDRAAQPLMIVECKAADVKITQETFEQIARYNLALKVPYLLVTNGQQHFFCRFDAAQNQYVFMDDMPTYDLLIGY